MPLPNPPLQRRSRKTLARIVEAGLALVRERGPEGLTVLDVVSRAGTSVGSFYQRFDGRESLLRYLDEVVFAEARAAFEGELALRVPRAAPLGDRVREVVEVLATAAPPRTSPEAGEALDATVADAVVQALGADPAEIRHADPAAAVRVGCAAVRGALRNPPPGVEPAVLREELVRLWTGYLSGTPSASESLPAEPVDPFEVWS